MTLQYLDLSAYIQGGLNRNFSKAAGDHFTNKVKYVKIATVMLLLFLFAVEKTKRQTATKGGDEERDLSKSSADVPSVSVDRRLLTKHISNDAVQSDNRTVLIYLRQHPYIIRYG